MTSYKITCVHGLDIFYREAGPKGRTRRASASRLPDQFAHVP